MASGLPDLPVMMMTLSLTRLGCRLVLCGCSMTEVGCGALLPGRVASNLADLWDAIRATGDGLVYQMVRDLLQPILCSRSHVDYNEMVMLRSASSLLITYGGGGVASCIAGMKSGEPRHTKNQVEDYIFFDYCLD